MTWVFMYFEVLDTLHAVNNFEIEVSQFLRRNPVLMTLVPLVSSPFASISRVVGAELAPNADLGWWEK